jgi:hypothetical protein
LAYDFIGKTIEIEGKRVRSEYPIRWEEIGMETFSRAQWDNRGKYSLELPKVNTFDYR